MSKSVIVAPGCAQAVAWSVAQKSKVSGHNGDGYLLLREGSEVRAYVIDGMGSGPEAHRAADAGLRAAAGFQGRGLAEVFQNVHAALKEVRGAALAGLWLDLKRMRMVWAAVGDIDGLVLRQGLTHDSLIQKGGTLGLSFQPPRPTEVGLKGGDVILLTTDGIRRSYRTDLPSGYTPQDYAGHVLQTHGRSSDDSLVMALQIVAAP